jgi:preprotein translocase subunit SecG
MVTLLTVVHITVCLFLILVVLLQAGKGGGMGIAFGGAGSQTVFGSSGAGNFLTRLTSITATIFLLTSLALAHYSSRQDSKRLQQLASEKAAEKKSDDEKAAKLKVDMEKIRAAAAGKSGGTSGTAPGSTTAGAPAPNSGLPLQLKMPGGPVTAPGTTVPSTEPAIPSTQDPSAKKPPAPGAVRKPALKRRTPPAASTPPAEGVPSGTPPRESEPAPETAPAPPAPAQ